MRNGLSPRKLHIPVSGQAESVIVAVLAEKIYAPVSQMELREKLLFAFQRGDILDAEGAAIRPDQELVGGSDVFIYQDPPDQDTPRVPLEILWENPAAMIVNKPAGLASMPRGKYIARSVVVQARQQFKNDEITLAHRLDRGTSGCLLLVKDPHWRAAYQEMFAKAQVSKVYQAFTRSCRAIGNPPLPLALQIPKVFLSDRETNNIPEEYLWKLKLVKSRDFLSVQALAGKIYHLNSRISDSESLKSAENYQAIFQFGEKEILSASLPHCMQAKLLNIHQVPPGIKTEIPQQLENSKSETNSNSEFVLNPENYIQEWEIKPATGFLHQIRVSLALIGQQIINDPLYPKTLPYGEFWDRPLGLRAVSLAFQDPYSRNQILATTPKMSVTDFMQ